MTRMIKAKQNKGGLSVMNGKQLSSSRGLTLVEVMVVTLIIALLAAVAIPNLLRARAQANDSAAQATLKGISNAMEQFASINSRYPGDTTSLTGATPPYLPTDYFTGTHNGYQFEASLTDYTYTVTATPNGTINFNTYTISTGGVLRKL